MAWMVNDYPDPPGFCNPVCPVCGEECERIFMDLNHNPIGCDNCVIEQDAMEWEEERTESLRYDE